jgi:DNA polymerase-3 subunit beta
MIAPEGQASAPGVIIPRKTINEVRRLLDDAGETVTMAVSAQKVRFGFGHVVMTSKVIDGSFPPYERVMPRDNKRVMMLDNVLFAAAVRRVATISNEQSRGVKLSVETGRMTLTVRNMDAGQAVEELEVDYEGEPFEIGFNAHYLLDVAGQIGGEMAEFRFAEYAGGALGLDPTLVLDPTDAGAQYVLMPMRV